MATEETQKLIIDTAIVLFNDQGTKAISTNRIADKCSLSRGLLHYHFKTKKDIIQAIFLRIDREMDASWYQDHDHPTIEHAHFMFERKVNLILRYRFFYWELFGLLRNDQQLKSMFMRSRRRREKEVRYFFDELIRAGVMVTPKTSASLDTLLQISWLVSDQWIYQLELMGEEVNAENIRKGFSLIYQGFEPYFTADAMAEYRRICQA